MDFKGHAVKAMFNAIDDLTRERIVTWFKEHDEDPWAYWARDEFLPYNAEQLDREQFVERHKDEFQEDLDEHTRVCYDPLLRQAEVFHFCDRLLDGLGQMYDEGHTKGAIWELVKDGDNYRVLLPEEVSNAS